jgi:acyl-CoA synthetase (AMP-forming)/AMP-acid ligase II
MDETIQSRFYRQVEKTPGGRAVAFFGPDGELAWRTYEDLLERGRRCAGWLREQGVGRGDVCILVLPSGELAATLLLGCLLRGVLPLLVAPPTLQGHDPSRTRTLNRIISRTRASLVVADEAMSEMRGELRCADKKLCFLGESAGGFTESTPERELCRPADSDIAAYQLTSGTTGIPRVCVWQQKNVIAALEGMAQAMDMREDDLCLNWTPLYHDMGLVNNFLFCITRGTPLVMLSPLEFVKKPALWLRMLSETGATLTWSPNFGFAISAQRIQDREIEGVRLDGVRAFWNAAERIHFETMRAFHERFSAIGVRWEALKTNYGCAENIGGATFSDPRGSFRVEHIDSEVMQEEEIAKPVDESGGAAAHSVAIVSAGRPYPGMKVQILSRSGRPLPEGHIGELGLDTPSRMVGYLANARETRRAIRGKLVRTGDMGYFRDGEFFWVGRVRERINVRGRKLDPSDFEPVLLDISGLRDGCFVAFGVDDAKRGTQRVVIVTEVRQPPEREYSEIPGEIRREVLRHLGITVDDVVLVKPGVLSKTSSGKRRHRNFRQQYLDGELEQFEIPSAGS